MVKKGFVPVLNHTSCSEKLCRIRCRLLVKEPSIFVWQESGGPQSQSWHCGEMRNFLALPRINPILWALHSVTFSLYKTGLCLNVPLIPQMCNFEGGMHRRVQSCYLFSTGMIVTFQLLMWQVKMTRSKLQLHVVTPTEKPKLHCCQNLEFILHIFVVAFSVFIPYHNLHTKIKIFCAYK